MIIVLGLLYFRSPDDAGFGSAEVELVPAAEAEIGEAIMISRRNAITRAVETASPAVVGINVTQVKEYRYRSPFQNDPFFRQFFPDRIYRQPVKNLGSGFIISPEGYILTNEHVVYNAVEIIITMADGSQHNGEIVGTDHLTDIALLEIKGDRLPHLRWADSDEAIIGEWAIAIGNPFGLFSNNAHPTVTVGVISAVDRDFQRNRQDRLYMNMIQTDASINPGNSGGPLLNSEGEVIGMNTMIFSESGGSIGLGFAIPSNKIQDVVEVLKEKGGINRDYWIGLSIQNVDQLIAQHLKMDSAQGVVITDVDPGSPAEKAGVQVADVIVSMNNREVKDKNSVQKVLSNDDFRVGDTLSMGIFREGRTFEVEMLLEPLPR